MKTLILILLFVAVGFGQQIATTEDGRKVILNQDGTWNYQPNKPKSPINKKAVDKEKVVTELKDFIGFLSPRISEFAKGEFEKQASFTKRRNELMRSIKYKGQPLSELYFADNPSFVFYNSESEYFSIRANRNGLVSYPIGTRCKLDYPIDKAKDIKSNIVLLSKGTIEANDILIKSEIPLSYLNLAKHQIFIADKRTFEIIGQCTSLK